MRVGDLSQTKIPTNRLQIGTGDKEYQTIVEANSFVSRIDAEILTVHKQITDLYSIKF